jgi:mono/diheme cytochrome c family protein
VIVALLTAAGCGGGHATTSAAGRKIFASQCSGCHTLSGREQGAVGGDLVLAHLRVKDLASFARVMPTKPRLSSAAANAVALYIASVARRR